MYPLERSSYSCIVSARMRCNSCPGQSSAKRRTRHPIHLWCKVCNSKTKSVAANVTGRAALTRWSRKLNQQLLTRSPLNQCRVANGNTTASASASSNVIQTIAQDPSCLVGRAWSSFSIKQMLSQATSGSMSTIQISIQLLPALSRTDRP